MNDTPRVLVIGAGGQVGRALLASAPPQWSIQAADHAAVDIGDAAQVRDCIAAHRPQLVINAAAYTAVEDAERDEATAARINGEGVRNIALALATRPDSRLIHISTDFVFDGGRGTPYRPGDVTSPLSVYGLTKRAGELHALTVMRERVIIVRTAWVYAARGRNFLLTMLRAMNARGEVRVVADQVGTPTAAASLAEVLWGFGASSRHAGIYHWTDAGVASWYDFAVAIAEEAAQLGLLERAVTVTPVVTAEYPTAAQRPAYSVLDSSATRAALGVAPVHWRVRLRSVMKELARE